MTVHRLPGTPTLGGLLFWTDVVNEKGWRIQHNKTLAAAMPLKPYRLLDPKDQLWASADELAELAQELPALIEEFAQKSPLFKAEDVKQLLLTIATQALTMATKAKARPLGKS